MAAGSDRTDFTMPGMRITYEYSPRESPKRLARRAAREAAILPGDCPNCGCLWAEHSFDGCMNSCACDWNG